MQLIPRWTFLTNRNYGLCHEQFLPILKVSLPALLECKRLNRGLRSDGKPVQATANNDNHFPHIPTVPNRIVTYLIFLAKLESLSLTRSGCRWNTLWFEISSFQDSLLIYTTHPSRTLIFQSVTRKIIKVIVNSDIRLLIKLDPLKKYETWKLLLMARSNLQLCKLTSRERRD